MSIPRRRRTWHPNLFQFLGIVILCLLAVNAVVVVESAGQTTRASFEDALLDFRGSNPDPQAVASGPTVERDGSELSAAAPPPVGTPAAPAAPEPTTGQPAPPAPGADERPGSERQAQPAPPFRAPEAGVYHYRGSGGEWLSMPGARREYPDESFATVRHNGGCQWEFEHRVAEEHVDRRVYCSQAGAFLFLEAETRVTFFGQSDGSHVVCDPPSVVMRTAAEPGATHTGACRGEDTETRERITYVGQDELDLGGAVVPAHRLRMEAEISGRAQGTSRADLWLHPDTGLLLRVERQTDTTTNAFGGRVRYQEEATFELLSLDPRT